MILNQASVFIRTSLLSPWGDSFNLAPIAYLIQGRLYRNKAREHRHIYYEHVRAAALPCVTETTEDPVRLDHPSGLMQPEGGTSP